MSHASRSVAVTRLACLLGAGAIGGCSVELVHGLDEREANEVVAALNHERIGADKRPDDKQGWWKVEVAGPAAASALATLQARELPRRRGKGVGEAFAEAGLVPSPSAERARLAASLGVDVARTLEAIPGVSLARVLVALPDPDPLRGEAAHPRTTASVVLRSRGPLSVEPAELRRIVASAVEGMLPADVNLVVTPEERADLAAAESLATLGPLEFSERSRPLIVALIVLPFVLTAALIAALLLLVRRR